MMLPPPIIVPCSFSCPNGTYITNSGGCSSCQPGQISNTELLYTHWQEFPIQSSTDCANKYYPCSKWLLKNTYIDTGKNYDYAFSNFHMSLEIFSPDAYVEFVYQVDAEMYYDYLSFYVNSDLLLRVSQQRQWTVFRHSLPLGFVDLLWSYTKDSIISVGEDLARIQSIRIHGAVDARVYCDLCPRGYFSTNSLSCSPCPVGTYSSSPGTPACAPCPPYQDSYEGATSCYLKSPPCNTTDQFSYLTQCNQGQQSRVFQWIQPFLCNQSYTSLQPIQIGLQCPENCPVGQGYQPSFGCQECAFGSFGDGLTNTCQQCPEGKYLTGNMQYYINFTTALHWKTGCSGECVSDGFRMLGEAGMDSGVGNGHADSWILIPLPLKDVTAKILMFLSCELDSVSFYMNDVQITALNCRDSSNGLPIPLWLYPSQEVFQNNGSSTGEAVLLIRYVTLRSAVLRIYNFTLMNGQRSTGFSACLQCPDGKVSSLNQPCLSCPGGTFAISGDIECNPCSANTYSITGSKACRSCGNGFISPVASPQCFYRDGKPCSYVSASTGMIFDWEPLALALKDFAFSGQVGTFYLNLDGLASSHCANGSYICLQNDNPFNLLTTGIVLANYADIEIYQNLGLYINMDNSKAVGSSDYYQVDMFLYCGTNAIFNPENDVTIIDHQTNQMTIEIDSIFGCPLCNTSDFEQVIGPCVDSKQKLFWRKVNSFCARGVSLMNESSFVDCIVEGYEFPLWAIAIIVAVFLILFGIALSVTITLIVRYRRLQNQFQMLVENEDLGHEKL